MMNSKTMIDDLSEYPVREIKKATRDQGHFLTGRLEQSTREKIALTNDGLIIEIVRNAYGQAIESGVPRNRIPFSPGSGAARSKYIQGLLDFVKRRNLKPRAGGTQLGIAFAIAKKQKQVGIPTVGSRRFSKTRRRTGAIAEFNQANKRYIRDQVGEIGLVKIEEIALESLAILESSFVNITQEL